jgi:hypothetical protein
MEPYVVKLQKAFQGLYVGQVRGASLGYVDHVNRLSREMKDLLSMDTITQDYEKTPELS